MVIYGEKLMLISFGASNYMSFKEGFEVSLELSPASSETILKDKTISEAICIVGANASGKTNVIRSLTYIADFCCNSFSKKPDDNLQVYSYGFKEAPSYFFVEFQIDDIRYLYELELTKEKVISENLKRKVARWVEMFSRKDNKITYYAKDLKELSKIKLRSNVSIISIAHQYSITAIENIYNFFSKITSNIDPFLGELMPRNISTISKLYHESAELLNYVKTKLEHADTGINDIHIEQFNPISDEQFFHPTFTHNTKDENISIPFFFESNGTQALYLQLSLFKLVLDQGGILLLDEFDNNLHPDLHSWLIDFFLEPESNPNNAQIVFTSHNAALMDKLGKYKTVLVNKVENESFLYRLDELPGTIVRNDRSIESVYKTGKLGGTPKL